MDTVMAALTAALLDIERVVQLDVLLAVLMVELMAIWKGLALAVQRAEWMVYAKVDK